MDEIWAKLYAAAKAVQQERQISDYVLAGGVAAAVLSKSGRIYTGVCIDTCSTLGICAERNAIFNMITNGEQEIDKVLCILPDGSGGTPCGACRELMVQLMPNGRYKDIEIMMDYAAGRIVKLGEITPEWWIKYPMPTQNGTGFPFSETLSRSSFPAGKLTAPLPPFSVPLPADPDMRSDGCRT